MSRSMNRNSSLSTRLDDIRLADIFERFVEVAVDYKKATGRFLQIWGELGELYAQVKFGVNLHRPHAQGSDGTLGNDFVEVKTISPEKTKSTVTVSRKGNFSKLLVVKIDDEFNFKLVFDSICGSAEAQIQLNQWFRGSISVVILQNVVVNICQNLRELFHFTLEYQ